MNVHNDMKLDLALGNSRKTKTWKNKTMLWSALLERLAKETRTSETVAEFKAMSLSQQSAIKDVGGYVGGYVNNGNRSDVRHRSILCLDADYADAGIWDDWCSLLGNGAALYSTHKHTPQKPRLRLLVPLARNVGPDEYQAVGRKVAELLGIDKFDDTTYQPQRLMFWPSTPQDGEYIFKYLDEPFLDPDEMLALYRNWQDISAWPMSSRISDIIRKTAKKQKDPLTKGGVVGAFCRAYTIQEAIETFIPSYQPCDDQGRYTYTEGSTAAGVVIYDDKFSYSHHATDPASGLLCNAWDLVRLHKYKALDTDCDPDVAVSSKPSYKAMSELATGDDKVRTQLVNDRLAEAVTDFSEDPLEDEDWKSKLKVTEKGGLAQTIENVVIILAHDPELKKGLAYDEMSHNILAMRDPPWRKVTPATDQWIDADDAALRYYLERFYGLSGKDKIYDAVNVVATEQSFHPVRDYLAGCTWDGVPRVDTLLIDYLGADDTAYTRIVTRKTLTAAVARIYQPGCKFDYMLTLRGAQGIGKSALINKLGGEWYSDTFTTVTGKESYEQVLGVWILEIGELAGMRRAEAETIKLFISKQQDRFRPAYGRRLQEFPRQCIFIGTTNEAQFLRDTTGNRRFWVVDCANKAAKDLWEDLTPEKIKLLWGEAVDFYRKGETLYLPGDMERVAREIQNAYEEENAKTGLVYDYLARLLPENWEDMDGWARRNWLESTEQGTVQRERVCTMEIWVEALHGDAGKFDRYVGKEIQAILSEIGGWKHSGSVLRTFKPYGRQRFYERIKS